MKKLVLLGSFIAVFFLGAGAYAFWGSSLFSSLVTATESSGPIIEIAIEDVICDENDECETIAGEVQVSFTEADNLPAISPDMQGLFVTRNGNELTLGTGSIEAEVSIEQVDDNEPVVSVVAAHSGPEVQLRVTDSTVIYLDETPHPEPTRADLEAGKMVVQRTVGNGDLASLAQNTMVRAWGSFDGDVLVADILVIEPIK